jgi:hypothetical protein
LQQQEERNRQHQVNLAATAAARAQDLTIAAEWFRLYTSTLHFIDECEKRWRTISPSGAITLEQQSWLAWARAHASKMSPFEIGYPDPSTDGPFDSTQVPFGGPYPPKRNLPRPPTMPKIPPPENSAYPSYRPAPQQYPFWLKH